MSAMSRSLLLVLLFGKENNYTAHFPASFHDQKGGHPEQQWQMGSPMEVNDGSVLEGYDPWVMVT